MLDYANTAYNSISRQQMPNETLGNSKMNRKKKMNDTLKKRLKKANAKLQKSNKPKYISKAEREKIALTEQESTEQESQQEV